MDANAKPPAARAVGMYSSCIFCHADLDRNETIESFPLGKRLAFDPARGRLWVVCPKCRGWNLTPLEERWEAIEQCERHYRDTRLRVSTDHIGLARLRDGMELVRIGEPQRPEFAAWRYGERLVLRRRKTMIQVGAGLAALAGVVGGGMAAGIGVMGMYWGGKGIYDRIVKGSPDKIITRISGDAGEVVTVRRKHLEHARLVSVGPEWELRVAGHTRSRFSTRDEMKGSKYRRTLTFHDQQALEIASRILPSVNRFGGTAENVQDAVKLIEEAPDPRRLFARLAQSEVGPLGTFAPEVRLALEMAAHEQNERLALEGELAALETAWRDAEQIASISDNMFLPPSVQDWMTRIRGR